MKRKLFPLLIIFISATLCIPGQALSQAIPPFKMTLSNNRIFSATELPKGKPTILIYFDPECEHCQKLMTEFFKKINEFKKAEIVMVTYKPVNEVAAFEKMHSTKKYNNIIVGTEGLAFYLRDYYGLMVMPFTALYDKKGNLSHSYIKETPVDDLISRLKKLSK